MSRIEMADCPEPWVVAARKLWTGDLWCLFLHGQVGTGKTCFAEAFYEAWKENKGQWHGAYFVPPDNLTMHVYDFETWPDRADIWGRTPLLVLDDLASQRMNAHLAEQVTMLLLRRHREHSRTIITTNLTVGEFAAAVDPRIASRLQEGEIINTGSRDLRKEDT